MVCNGNSTGMYTGVAFEPIIATPNPSVINVAPAIYKVTNDIDQKIVVAFPPVDLVPRCFFQVRVNTVGTTAGQILSAGISFGSNL